MTERQLELSCELLVFLDNSGDLENMRREAETFMRSLNEKKIGNFPPFTYLLHIDVMKLMDQNADLGEMLMTEPFRVQNMCTAHLYACLQIVGKNSYAEMVERCQLNVTLRLACVPTTIVVPNQRPYNGIVCFKGLLMAVTKPTTYVAYSVWACPEECECNEIVFHHLPKHAPKCLDCKAQLFEKSRLRRCGERVTATLRIAGTLLPRHVVVPDDLIQNLTPGNEYFAFGVILRKSLHAWAMETMVKTPITVVMPKAIDKLHRKCGGRPYKFVYCLASSLAVDICPMNEFMHLKITLLLNLASLKSASETERSIVHVLAVGADCGYVPRIMDEAAKYTNRSMTVGGSNAAVSDALLASSEGVCVLPLPIHTYPQKFTHNLIAAIEKNEISIEEGQLKLKSAVWAHGCDGTKFHIANVASVFGMVCRGDPTSEEALVDFMLQRAVNPCSDRDDKSASELAEYLELISGTAVTLDHDAEELLNNYFLTVRRCDVGANALTAHGLAALCRASARLCARARANSEDALLAVWLHASVSGAPAELTGTPERLGEWELIMGEFKTWLSDYIGRTLDIYYNIS